MSYRRFSLDLAIKEPISDTMKTLLTQEIVPAIRKLKSYASNINEGQPNEEMTVRATWHICYHDEGKPCEPEQEI